VRYCRLKALSIYYNYCKLVRLKMKSKQDVMMASLQDFYSKSTNMKKLLDMVQNGSGVSLRVIDHLVTNYAQKHDVIYDIKRGKKVRKFFLYLDYKAQLKAYSKKQFDPFCRDKRILFKHKNVELETTVGQLNFFRWAIDNNVITYAKRHLKKIKDDLDSKGSGSGSGSGSGASGSKTKGKTKSTSRKTSTVKKTGQSSKSGGSGSGGSKSGGSKSGGTKNVKSKKSHSTRKMISKHNVKLIVSLN
jgi:hypothetical protein